MEKPVNILLVDDDAGMLKTMNYILSDKGFEVVALNNGPDAMELIKKKTFDIVFSDIKMPGMNGVELLKKIKRLSPETDVLMITAYTMHDLVEQAKKAGANAIFSKPLDLDRIISYIEKLGSKGQETEPASNNEIKELYYQLEEKDRQIIRLQKELAEIKSNPALILEKEKKKKQSENVADVLNLKQYELYKILSQGEKNYNELLEAVKTKDIDINDLAALRLQLSRLSKRLEQETLYKVERIRRDKILYFKISSS